MRFTLCKVVSANLITTKCAKLVVMIASKVAMFNCLLVPSISKYASESLADKLTNVKVNTKRFE